VPEPRDISIYRGKMQLPWCGWRESNPRFSLGKAA
jgi:hypothetical protein